MSESGIGRARGTLLRLARRMPQVLLLEGGSEPDRFQCACYWATLANCSTAQAAREKGGLPEPCSQCQTCRQIMANEYIDLHIYDGRISNRQDEDSPGPVRALNMDNMHALKRLNATAPHGSGKRVAIFQGMGQTREEALNSLLKTLEEPTDHTLFVLLSPQRQQLLPTLVSRSFCVTLPWRGCRVPADASLATWENLLGAFLNGSPEFLEKIAARGAVDASLAGRIIMSCQQALGRVLGGFGSAGPLDKALSALRLNIEAALLVQRWAAEAHEMLALAVAPARVLEAFCSRLYILLRRKP